MPEEPGLADVIAEQRELLSRMRAVVEAKDADTAALRQELEASRERERRKDRKRGGQPGHQGKGLQRDPDPGEKKDAAPPPGAHAG